MKYSRILLLAFLMAAGLSAASCAVSASSDDSSQDRILKAWININYPGLQARPSGVYVLSMDSGSGSAITDSSYVFVHYTRTDLEGTVASTNYREKVAQLGNLESAGYYGSDIWRVDKGFIPEGLEDVIKGLRVGGSARIVMPVSASYVKSSVYDAFPSNEEANVVYSIFIDDVVSDITAWQEKMLNDFKDANFQYLDSLRGGFYLKKMIECPQDTVSEGDDVKVEYIGRLIENGMVFDTNIQDTAKLYRIYDDSRSYDPMTITYKAEEEAFFEENNIVKGFGYAIRNMNYGETAICFFLSDLGYGAGGSDPSIPEYAPLCFWIHIQEDD